MQIGIRDGLLARPLLECFEVAIEIEISRRQSTADDRSRQIAGRLRRNFAETLAIGGSDAAKDLRRLSVSLARLDSLDLLFQMPIGLHEIFDSIEVEIREQQPEGQRPSTRPGDPLAGGIVEER